MVEVFEKREIERLFDVAVLFPFGKLRRQIDCELLIADGMFENALVLRL